MSNIALSVQAVHKSVELSQQEINILSDINLNIPRGDSLAIVGSSGSGKSTLLGLMAGLDNVSSGLISLMNNNLTEMSEDQRAKIRAKHVGFVFQSFLHLDQILLYG